MPVEVQLVTHMDTPDTADIETWAEAVLASPPVSGMELRSATGRGELCIRIVDEEESRRLNRDYRGKDSPTNVLSFPADVDVPEMRLLGDVVICAPVVQREALAQHKQYRDHFAHMVVHGVLHLLGYDHETTAEAGAMEERERRILDGFGVSDPYGEG